MHLFIREESNPQYDQIVWTLAEKQGIDTACLYTVEDLFKNMKKDSNLQDEIKFLHHAIPTFKGPLKKQNGFMTSEWMCKKVQDQNCISVILVPSM